MAAGRAGKYGIDAPYVPFGWLLGAVAAFAAGGLGLGFAGTSPGVLQLLVGLLPLLVGVVLVLGVLCYLHTTRRGKFVLWSRIIDGLALTGTERVLDLGCGRGAVLLAVAGRLTTGKAVGVDLWRGMDQSGNAEAATLRNAEAEGVADRVELHTADLTKLPFGKAKFQVVVSSLALHNIRTAEGRATAIDEAVRVLRPGGRLVIADLRATREYQARLTELGLTEVRRQGLGWLGWWSGPWTPTTLVTATKPLT